MKYSVLQICVVCLVVVVIFLQIIHFVLFSWLDGKRNEANTPRGSSFGHRLSNHNKSLDIPLFKLDTSGSYQIYYSVEQILHKRTKIRKKLDVILVTHCTSQNLLYLPRLVEAWKGPMSVTVFTVIDQFSDTLSAILNLVNCHSLLQEFVTFHVVHPLVDRTLATKLIHSMQYNSINCGKELDKYITTNFKDKNYALSGTPYPINLVRNVGRFDASSDFLLITDVDMVPSRHLRKQFLDFYENKLQDDTSISAKSLYFEQNLFILPAFELKDDVAVPGTKKELMELIENGDARQFYIEPCKYCHGNTNYARWHNHQISSVERIDVAYGVEFHQKWEPFYISHKNVPLYDERFKQYGYNRISQVCETYVAGYNFLVLDNAFLIHQGFKYSSQFHSQKDDENRINYELFLKFTEELKTKYSGEQRICLMN